MNPVLFLDVDGVLNSEEWMRAGHMRSIDADAFAPHLCARLDRVVVASGCDVVISSSWRIGHTLHELRGFLRTRGAPVAASRVIGVTPAWRMAAGHGIVGAYDRRGGEIQAWLDDHPRHGPVAIVDDSDDMGHLAHRLVLTSWQRGIEDEHVERLIALLSEAA